ncbi:MAG: porin [Planctomycetaceae bacterium]|nr:porin [Planctomycetaceae bacterium]
MKKTLLFWGLAVLLWGTSTAIGQNWLAQSEPCDPCGPNPCGPLFANPDALPLNVSGWVDFGVFTNAHGFNNNGPMFTDSKRRNDFGLSQLYLELEKTMNTKRGFDWGAKTDLVYGSHAGSMQCFGDETFDFGLGKNRNGYELAIYQLYGSVGYGDLSVKAGKFITTLGWEGSASRDNFFHSHSYLYMIEAATHMGVLADYALTDRLSVNFGWTTGMDSSFANPNNNQAVLTGFTWALADDATIIYAFSGGQQSDGETMSDYFNQSLCLEWLLTDRFTYVLQYNLRNDNARGGESRLSAYGINNHFLYKLDDQWAVGTRFEWFRDNGSWGITENNADYYQLTWGLNWRPFENVLIRPEIRYDWVHGASPFGSSETFGGIPEEGVRSTQLSGGCGIVLTF